MPTTTVRAWLVRSGVWVGLSAPAWPFIASHEHTGFDPALPSIITLSI